MPNYFINHDMVAAPPATATFAGNAVYVSGSPSYVRLTQAINNQNGGVSVDFVLPDAFDINADIYANGGADAIFAFWGCTTIPTSEDAAPGYGGYIVAWDEYNDVTQLWFNGTLLYSVGFAGNYGDATRRLVRVEVRQQNIKVYVADVLIIDYTDIVRVFPGAKVGYGGRTGGVNAEHRIYNFNVASYTAPVVTAPNVVTPYSGYQNLDSKYTLEILDNTGSLVADLTGRAKARNIKLIRNGVYEAAFEVDLDMLEQYARQLTFDPRSILAVGQNQVKISRNGVPLFGGQIMLHEGTLSEEHKLIVRAVGWLELLNNKYTASLKTFSATDAGTIAKTLIDDAQTGSNASFGILTSSGYIQASVNRDRTYEYQNVKEAIIRLSEVKNGFDFEFTWDKKFYVYYPQMGGTRTEFTFEYPGNIKKIVVSEDGKQLVTQAIVRGQGFGEAQTVVTRDDTTAQTAYKVRTKILDEASVIETATLQDKGDEVLRVQGSPLKVLKVTLDGNRYPPIGAYGLGDRVNVKVIGYQMYPVDAYYRIDEINIKISDDDSEEIELKLTL